MSKNITNLHHNKNIKNYLISNFVITSKKIILKEKIKCYFFYNSFNFYLSIFILFNFWISNLEFKIKKEKIIFISCKFNFFMFFSYFIYPNLFNTKIFSTKKNNFLYFTFFINSFFFNPLFKLLAKIYVFSYSKTFNIFKFGLFLEKKKIYFISFYLNFFQIPFFLK